MGCFARAALAQDVAKPVAGEPVYYWNGDMRVDLILALDELGLGAGATFKAVVKEFTAIPDANQQIVVQVVPEPFNGQYNATLNGLQVIPQP
jgi:ribose 5-phosphate isomerase